MRRSWSEVDEVACQPHAAGGSNVRAKTSNAAPKLHPLKWDLNYTYKFHKHLSLDAFAVIAMAPTKKNNAVPSKTKHKKGSGAPSKAAGVSKSKSRASARPPPKEQKSKPVQGPKKKRRREYTEEELGIPKLNMISPAGVQKPKGKKKGKTFVDDQVCCFFQCLVYCLKQAGFAVRSELIESDAGDYDDDSGYGECGQGGAD